jgi:histidyl-tRNA synthetase
VKFKAVQGTQDFLIEKAKKWQHIEEKIRSFMKIFNYSEVRTPIFEYTDLFARGIGQQTDIVSKEMYTFKDSGDRMLTLRPENTASICRMTLEHNIIREMPQSKLYYIGPMFRRERPQKGRYRQFHQFGCEALGAKSPELDAEMIILAHDFYNSFGLKNLEIKINSVGNLESRNNYKKALKEFIEPNLSNYCEDCRSRFEKNPLRILDCKKDHEKNKNAPVLYEYLDEESKSHFDKVLEILKDNNIELSIDHNLVRGLDYYTDTVFEVISHDLGAQSAICGGGRYDLLIEELGGKPTPAVGFAGGIERLFIALEEMNYNFPEETVDLFVVTMDENAKNFSNKFIRELRLQNISVDTDFLGRGLKAQMKFANKIQAKYIIVLGSNELESGKVELKKMDDGSKKMIKLTEIMNFLK